MLVKQETLFETIDKIAMFLKTLSRIWTHKVETNTKTGNLSKKTDGERNMNKKSMIKTGVVAGLLVILVVCFSVFSSSTKNELGGSRAESAGLDIITHVTSDVISADTHIAIRFRDEQVTTAGLEKRLLSNPFTFTPHIDGKAYWQDTRTLVFEPDKPLYEKRDYHGVLDLAKVYAYETEDKKFEFHFRTLGQKLGKLAGRFELCSPKDPENVYFIAAIQLAERVDADIIKQAFALKLEGKPLIFAVATQDGLNFTIKSESLKRYTLQDQTLELLLAKEPLHLGQDLKEEFVLAALKSPLTVLRIEEEKSNEFSRLRVVFSEELNPNLDYNGYINISPGIDFSTTVDHNCLIISGPFRYREKYSIQLFKGIECVYGQALTEEADYLWEVAISDRYPEVEFISSGIFLPSTNEKRIAFRTMNVHRLRLQVKRVAEENLIKFFEENSYRPHSYSSDDYNRYRFQRLGEVITDQIVEIGTEMNKWIQTELDLSNVITDEESALYIVQLEVDENQILDFPAGYDDWDIGWHVRQRGTAVKHILVSDIGITAKQMPDEIYVFVTDLLTVKSVESAIVMLKDGAGKTLDTAYSDEYGLAALKSHDKGRYIEVRTGDDFAMMSLNSSLLNQSVFDIGGIQKQDGINVFVYTERGVYRPGDEINLCAIVRNEDNTFPQDHPVRLRIVNSQNKFVYDITNTKAVDGFYNFKFKTESNAPTGTWTAYLDIGNRTFSHYLRIEEIVPYRIRVNIDTEQETFGVGDEQLDFAVGSEYLFGEPAAGLHSETTVYIEPYNVEFAGYKNFVFGNESIDAKRITGSTYEEILDENGKIELIYNLPKNFHEVTNVPSALRLLIDARVYESGGRFVPNTKAIPLEHYSSYVGIMQLEDSELSIGEEAVFNIVHLNADGQPIADSELEYTIYRSRMYWWWEYGSEINFRRHFKSSKETAVLEQGIVTTNSEGFADLKCKFGDYGELLLEVKDPRGGHAAGYFFSSYWWGDSAEKSPPDIVNLKLDKSEYLPGETAIVSLNTPCKGRALITVEKEGDVFYRSWEDLTSTKLEFPIEVKEEYIPNAYVSVIVYQPYGQTDNDLPLRMYGIVPLKVISEGTEIEFTLDAPNTIRPEETFTLTVQTTDHQPAQFTIALVDEGLLNITNFKTPNPWAYFFQKQRLITRNYDNFSDIIGLIYGYSHNLLTVGGDGAEPDYREQQLKKDEDVQRFKPVSIFLGPFMTDESGYKEVPLQVPNYIGSVKVMVVGANQGKFGCAEKSITVRSPLMVLPTLPRVLGPSDKIRIPVTVFALEENLGEVNVSLDAAGPVKINGPSTVNLDFTDKGEQEVFFELTADDIIGRVDITVSAVSNVYDYCNMNQVELAVRSDNPYIYLSEEKLVDLGEIVHFTIPDAGIKDTDTAQLVVSTLRGLNLNHRIKWLTRYPYGCIEQVTSGVFPQLYLPDVFKFSSVKLMEIDKNINTAIALFREYQLSNGGFAYWPNQTETDLWSTNYAGHFLLEARNKGYYVPQDMLEMWINYQRQAARENKGNILTRAYRLYLLALANQADISAMNYMRESEITKMNNPGKSYLAAAYALIGFDYISEGILRDIDFDAKDYDDFDITFGSKLRDQAILLDILTLFGNYTQGVELYNEIAAELASNKWYSTQTTAYSLLALTKYVDAVGEVGCDLTGVLTIANDTEELQLKDYVNVIPIEANRGKTLTFRNESDLPLFVTLEWEGIPERGKIEPVQSKLTLDTYYYNEVGDEIDITRVKQGESFYAVFRVDQEKPKQNISELALVQVLPAGWEIENLRLLGGQLPDWCDQYKFGIENYVDIRDDRIIWFFDMSSYTGSYDFLVKINAVTVGEFYLPPTLLEAMYNNDYKVTTKGMNVEVVTR